MKFKDFRETEVFKAAEIVKYYSASNKLEVPDKLLDFKNIKNREVTILGWEQTPPIKTLCLLLDI